MKKIFAFLLASLTVLSATAAETITVWYGWSPSDVAANFSRTIVEEANRGQNKYLFILDFKPGAGASIAAQHVAKTPNTILATSTAFWIRPNFFPGEYRVEDFREIMPNCDAPLEVVSKRYKSWKEVPTDRPLTIGVSGLGITTHLVATEVAKKYPQLLVVPFKSTTESTLSALGGQTDFSVNFMGDGDQYINSTNEKLRMYALGITGSTPNSGIATLVSQGFPKTLSQMNAPSHLVVANSMPEDKFKEIRAILVRAGNTAAAKKAFSVDHCSPLTQMPDDLIQPWFNKQNATWKGIASGISLK